MNGRDEFMFRVGANTYVEAQEMAAQFTGYDEIISHLQAERDFDIGKMTFRLRDGKVELLHKEGATFQHHLFGGAVLRELCKRWSADRGGSLTVKQIVQKIEELIERHDKMLKYEYHLGASEALDELRDWIIKMKGGEK